MVIEFQAAVYKVQTLVDGGIRITLDLPEGAIMQMAQLAECQRNGWYLAIAAQVDDAPQGRLSTRDYLESKVDGIKNG